MVGWPLPHRLPNGLEAAHAFGASIPDSFWPRLFAILAWLAWACFAFSVATNVVLRIRGRRPGTRRYLVGSGATAALIAAVLILGQLRGGHAVRSGPPVRPAPVVQLLADVTPGEPPGRTKFSLDHVPGRAACRHPTGGSGNHRHSHGGAR